MVKIDLITGFLGSGKTTFIKKYAEYLIGQGMNIGILENDYGAVNVDMMLLQDLMGEKCELEMVSGGCDKETHRRRFRTKLISMGMCGYDRVIVEPSGIYDVDEFFDVLRDDPLDRWYEIGSVIAVADATLEKHLSAEADYLLASEVSSAGCVILSKTDLANEEDKRNTIAHLNHALAGIGCKRVLEGDEILEKTADSMTDADFERIMAVGYKQASYRKMDATEEDFTSLYFLELHKNVQKLGEAARQILADPACGHVFLIKGFAKEDGWKQINATRDHMLTADVAEGQEVLIVIGENLQKEKIETYLL